MAAAAAFAAKELDAVSLARDNAIIEAELSLAEQPIVYFHFDLAARRVVFKAKGEGVREINFTGVRMWGRPASEGACRLVAVKTWSRPKREAIAPGEASKPLPEELKAMELRDMPSSYRMVFDNGVIITVHRSSDGPIGLLGALGWYSVRPLKTLWYAVQGKRYVEAQVLAAPDDAKALYWSMLEGSKSLMTWMPVTQAD